MLMDAMMLIGSVNIRSRVMLQLEILNSGFRVIIYQFKTMLVKLIRFERNE